jgi:hypothetical protein
VPDKIDVIIIKARVVNPFFNKSSCIVTYLCFHKYVCRLCQDNKSSRLSNDKNVIRHGQPGSKTTIYLNFYYAKIISQITILLILTSLSIGEKSSKVQAIFLQHIILYPEQFRIILALSGALLGIGVAGGFFISLVLQKVALETKIDTLLPAAITFAFLGWLGSGVDILGLLREMYKDYQQEKNLLRILRIYSNRLILAFDSSSFKTCILLTNKIYFNSYSTYYFASHSLVTTYFYYYYYCQDDTSKDVAYIITIPTMNPAIKDVFTQSFFLPALFLLSSILLLLSFTIQDIMEMTT